MTKYSAAEGRTYLFLQEVAKMWFCNLMVTDKAEQNQGHATFVMDEMYAKVRSLLRRMLRK